MTAPTQATAREAIELPPLPEPTRDLLGRCLSVLSTLEGEDTTEQEMLSNLTRDIKQAMGITPLIPGSLI